MFICFHLRVEGGEIKADLSQSITFNLLLREFLIKGCSSSSFLKM